VAYKQLNFISWIVVWKFSEACKTVTGDSSLKNGIDIYFGFWGASLVAQMVTHLPAMRETRVWSLSQEDPLEKEMATHSRTLAWKIPWMEELGRLQSMRSQSRTWLNDFTLASGMFKNLPVWYVYKRFFFLVTLYSIWRILVLQPGIRLVPLELGAQSLNHWTTREVPIEGFWV